MREGALITIGARPSVGKTTFMHTLAENFLKQNKKVMIFTLEISAKPDKRFLIEDLNIRSRMMNKNLEKPNKANIVFLNNVQYIENSKIYKSAECTLKEEFCNPEFYLKRKTIEMVCEEEISLDFNRTEYFKVDTDILPWSDKDYLDYFNNLNINVSEDEIENEDDIVLTHYFSDILVCFQTKAVYGVYKTVMKYNLFSFVKEINCDLWAPLDIRKPFKLVEKTKKKPAKKLKAIGEIRQEPAWWAIYHPFQLRCTISNLEREKTQLKLHADDSKLAALDLELFQRKCELLKIKFFLEDDDDIEIFLENYPQFW